MKQTPPTISPSEALAAKVDQMIANGEDPLGDDEPLDAVSDDDDDKDQQEATTANGVDDDPEIDEAAVAAEAAAAAASTAAEVDAPEAQKPPTESSQAGAKLDEEALRAVVEDDDELDDVPAMLAVPKDDFKAKIEAVEGREAEIEAKWTDGKLTDAERNKELKEIRKEINELTRAQTRAETIAELNTQNAIAYQSKVLSKLAAASKAAGQLDYADAKNQAAFDRMLNAVAGDPDNSSKSFREIAQLAHDALCATRGLRAAVPTPTSSQAAAPAPQQVRKPPKPPVTLRDLPTASTPHTGGDALDALANLKGQDLQAAFNRMTPAQQAKMVDG